jgi:hypothetical protein
MINITFGGSAMKQIFHKRNLKFLILFTFSCFLITGCSVSKDKVQDTNQQTDELSTASTVYRVMPSNRTTSQWENAYGVVSHDGEMILPIENQEVYIICDEISGEQLWIQTSKQVVEDPNLTAEDLWTGDNWEKVHNEFTLYDLEGNLVKHLGQNGIQRVCDNWVLYYTGRLEDRISGEVYFDDVNNIFPVDEGYILNAKNYTTARVVDRDMNILYETLGGFIYVDNRYYISAEQHSENGTVLKGLQRLDGTAIIPHEYEYFSSSDIPGVSYIKAERDNRESVISLIDGSVVYQETGEHPEYDYVQYMLKDCMTIQTREVVATAENGGWPIYQYYTRIYDYNGNPMSEKYSYLSPYRELYANAQQNSSDATVWFSASTMDGHDYIIDKNGEVIFDVGDNWISVLSEERFILHDNENDSNYLCDIKGNRIGEKEYQYMHELYFESGNGNVTKSGLIMANYQLAGKNLYDLIDYDGNVILERCKNIQGLSENRFWVEKGFSQGLMDRDGNWIYEQSVFASAAEE